MATSKPSQPHDSVQPLVQSSVVTIGQMSGISQTLVQSPVVPVGQMGVVINGHYFL